MSLFKKDGERVTLRKTGQPVKLFMIENFAFTHFLNEEVFGFIDAVAGSGANGIRVFGFYPFGKGREEEPYRRAGHGFDYSRLNEAFVKYLHRWMSHANRRGVAVLYELFDSSGLRYRQFLDYHPFGHFSEGNLNAFSDLSNDNMVTHQKNYLTHIVSVLRQYPNVIFGIMNEFVGKKEWHYEMSRHVRALAPDHLIAGTAEHSPALDDPTVDIWASHCATYDKDRCRSNLDHDMAEFRPKIRGKIPAYSTDGFGRSGIPCEEPDPMRALAQDVVRHNLPIFRFLDHKGYVDVDDAGTEYPFGTGFNNPNVYGVGWASRLNTSTYRAIAEIFQPTRLAGDDTKPVDPNKPVSSAVVAVFEVADLPGNHPEAYAHRGGRAINATRTQGYLCFGPRFTAAPLKYLDAYFSVYIDNNTADNHRILTLDVYDALSGHVLAQKVLSRRQFPVAGAFNLFNLRFRLLKEARLEFRIFYEGWSYVAADRIALVDPKEIEITSHAQMLTLQPGSSPIIDDTAEQDDQGTGPATGNVILQETLKDGRTQGQIGDGQLTGAGVQLRGGDSFIGYRVPTLAQGYLEFSAKGFVHDELHGGREYKGLLLSMWDEAAGYSYESVPFVFELRKYGYIEGRPDASNCCFFKILSHREWGEGHKRPFEWNPATTYRFRVEWGGGQARVFRDGQLLNEAAYRAEFTPPNHKIQIGANPLRGRKTAHNLLISDVVIGKL